MKRAFIAGALLFVFTAPSMGCTMCDTETGRQVREGIFNADFGTTLLSVFAPFPVLLVAIGILLWVPGLLEPKQKN